MNPWPLALPFAVAGIICVLLGAPLAGAIIGGTGLMGYVCAAEWRRWER